MTTFHMRIGSAVFPSLRCTRAYQQGISIQEALMLAGIPESAKLRVWLNGSEIGAGHYARVRPRAGALLEIGIVPSNELDSGTYRVALSILTTLVGFGGIARGIGGVGGFIAGAAFTAAGTWLINALIPPPRTEAINESDAGQFRNSLTQYGAVPYLCGRMRIFPPHAANPIVETVGQDLFVRALFALGQRGLHVPVRELKIGDTPLADFEDYQFEVIGGYQDYTKPWGLVSNLYSSDEAQREVARELRWAPQWWEYRTRGTPINIETLPESLRSNPIALSNAVKSHRNVVGSVTAQNTQRITLDFVFPDGLGRVVGEELREFSVQISIRFRPFGVTDERAWQYVPPVYLPNVVNDDLDLFISTDTFVWLDAVNDLLEAAVTLLNGISAGERLVSAALWAWINASRHRFELAAENAMNVDESLTTPQRNEITRTRNVLEDLAANLDAAAIQHAEIANEARTYNNLLSGIIGLLEFIDTWIEVRAAIQRGYGPDLDEILPSTPWMNALFRWGIARRGLTSIFGSPETGAFIMTNSKAHRGAFRFAVSWPVAPGQYEVEARRVSEPRWGDNQTDVPAAERTYDSNVLQRVDLVSIRSTQLGAPISVRAAEDCTLVALRIRTTNQIGNLDSFNCIAEAPVPWHDGAAWRDPALRDDDSNAISTNPAWILAGILRGIASREPVPDARIDHARLIDFAAHCAAQRYGFSEYYSAFTTLDLVKEDACRAGSALPIIRDGRESVIIDQPKDRVAIITPRVASGFRASRGMDPAPHCLRIPYIDPDNGWSRQEWLVFADGYGDSQTLHQFAGRVTADGNSLTLTIKASQVIAVQDLEQNGAVVPENSYTVATVTGPAGEDVTRITLLSGDWPSGVLRWRVVSEYPPMLATHYETVNIPGLVDTPNVLSRNHTGQVYALGRKLIKARTLRREVFELTQDFERLTYERGDRVDVQYDVTQWGLGSARVVSLTRATGDVATIKIDERMAAGTYGVLIRDATNTIYQTVGVVVIETPDTFTLTAPLDDGGSIERDDLVTWGVVGRVTTQCIVRDIRSRDDLTADVTLIEHAASIHDAPDELAAPFDPNITEPVRPELTRPPAPEIVSVRSDESVLLRLPDGGLQSRIVTSFRIPPGVGVVEQAAARNVGSIAAQYALLPIQSASEFPFSPVVSVNEILRRFIAPTSWRAVDSVSAGVTQIAINGVEDEAFYSVRLRAITRDGIPSAWTFIPYHRVIGKTSRPPAVQNLRQDGDRLVWDYTPPLDFAGFKVRGNFGTAGAWEAGAPMHEGLLTENSFLLPDFRGGPRLYLVKAVDVLGLESDAAAVLAVNYEPAVFENLLDEFDQRALSWPGTITNGEIDSAGALAGLVGSKSAFYIASDAPLYRAGSVPFYQTVYDFFSYEFSHETDDALLPYRIVPECLVDAERWRLEWRAENLPVFPESGGAPIFPSEEFHMLFPDSGWRPYTSPIQAQSGITYHFRIACQPSNDPQIIEQFTLKLDARTIEEFIDSFVVADSGTVRLPVVKVYRAIRFVALTIIQSGSYTAQEKAFVVDFDPSGPAVEVMGPAQNRVAGLINAHVRGY